MFPVVGERRFWKADTVKLQWSPRGNALLCTTTTEMDTTNKSYYGEQQLHLVLTTGLSYSVNLGE
jgi:translation initiation factor 2A